MYGRNKWQLDWFVMNNPQPGYEAWLQAESGGWDSPGTSSTKSQRVNTHGAVISPVWKTERSISLEGRAYARTDAEVKRLAAYIKGLCSDPHKTYRLSSTTEIGEFETQVKLDGPILIDSGNDLSSSITFSIQLVAADPRLYRTEWQRMTTGLAQENPSDGLDFGPDLPNEHTADGLDFEGEGLSFGATVESAGFVDLRNSGTAPAPVEFTLTGPLTNPSITTTDVDGNSYTIRYNGTLATATDFVVINPEHPSVLLGGTASRRENVSPADFHGFYIPAAVPFGDDGQLRVGLTHEGSLTATGTLSARWRAASW